MVSETTVNLQETAHRYQDLATDERLASRDRARPLLWVGTALDKVGEHDYSTRVMAEASREFEELSEAEDWATAQQKLALAYRGAGDLDQALHFIDLTHESGTTDTPMQRVRLNTAHAHILLSDKQTCEHGLALLDQAAQRTSASGLTHQLRSIHTVCKSFENTH